MILDAITYGFNSAELARLHSKASEKNSCIKYMKKRFESMKR